MRAVRLGGPREYFRRPGFLKPHSRHNVKAQEFDFQPVAPNSLAPIRMQRTGLMGAVRPR